MPTLHTHPFPFFVYGNGGLHGDKFQQESKASDLFDHPKLNGDFFIFTSTLIPSYRVQPHVVCLFLLSAVLSPYRWSWPGCVHFDLARFEIVRWCRPRALDVLSLYLCGTILHTRS